MANKQIPSNSSDITIEVAGDFEHVNDLPEFTPATEYNEPYNNGVVFRAIKWDNSKFAGPFASIVDVAESEDIEVLQQLISEWGWTCYVW